MSGLFVLFIAVAWFFFVLWLTVMLTRKMQLGAMTTIVGGGFFLLLLVAPIADEIVGGRQFAKLCEENSTIQVDRAKAAGRTVYLNSLPEKNIQDTWVPVSLQRWQFVDVTTGEPVVNYNTLRAKGGWFIRALGIFEGNEPLTFKSTCAPKNRPASTETFKEFGINYIEPPITKNREKK